MTPQRNNNSQGALKPAKMNRLFLQFALLTAFTTIALSCTCLPKTFEENFCTATNSIHVFITSGPVPSPNLGNLYTYTAFVLQTFKGSTRKFIFLSTPTSSAACGVTFTPGSQYLLSLGSLSPGLPPYYHVSSCSFPKPWGSVSSSQRAFLDNPTCGIIANPMVS